MEILGCDLVITCDACPEQYDVFHNGEQIGYLRLRHGYFAARYGGVNGPTVYESDAKGDGSFNDGEREYHLVRSVANLLNYKESKADE